MPSAGLLAVRPIPIPTRADTSGTAAAAAVAAVGPGGGGRPPAAYRLASTGVAGPMTAVETHGAGRDSHGSALGGRTTSGGVGGGVGEAKLMEDEAYARPGGHGHAAGVVAGGALPGAAGARFYAAGGSTSVRPGGR